MVEVLGQLHLQEILVAEQVIHLLLVHLKEITVELVVLVHHLDTLLEVEVELAELEVVEEVLNLEVLG